MEMNEKLMEEFGRQIYELGIVKQVLENKEVELKVESQRLWIAHVEAKAKLELELLSAQKAYFEMATANKLQPVIMNK